MRPERRIKQGGMILSRYGGTGFGGGRAEG